jgi:hypothetical protein
MGAPTLARNEWHVSYSQEDFDPMRITGLKLQLLTAAMLGSASMTPALAASDGWDWSVAPYLWATEITTDAQVRGQPVGTDTDFSDIVDNLDFAFLLHAEGQGDQFGVMADYIYLGVSDDSDRDAFALDASLDTTIFELAAVWSPGDERHSGFEAFAGLRYLNTEADLKFDLSNPALPDQRRTLDNSFTDAMIGARYNAKLSDRWGLMLRGDGSFGDTEGGYNASAIFQYQTGGGVWALGYRYMSVELKTGSGESLDLTLSGPIVGYVFRF